MEFTAVFESWLIQDGDYPPFHRGQVVNLAFQMEPDKILPAKSSQPLHFHNLGNAEYDFCGLILWTSGKVPQKKIFGIKVPAIIAKPRISALVVIDTGDFRFYIQSTQVNRYEPGERIRGKGTLLLDCFTWAEFLYKRSDPPDIFYTLEVSKIRMVQIPERFIYRHEKAKSHPTRVAAANFGDVTELETMDGQKWDEEFYLVDFKPSNLKDVPKTFLM